MTKTYVITGATSGIGLALLQELAGENIIFAGYRNKNFIKELEAISPNIYPFYVDYSKPETIKLATEYIVSKTTKIDTLVNVAGCVVAGAIEKIPIENLKHQFDVNVFGHVEFTRNLLEILDGGRIINISSMSSYGIFPFISPYCASKRALDILFNSLLLETKKDIKVISIKPGAIATPLWEKSIEANSKILDNSSGFEKEMCFMIENARKNQEKGTPVKKVVETILKADRANNPKLSYSIGLDAICAGLFSKLPQRVINKLIKIKLKSKLDKVDNTVCK